MRKELSGISYSNILEGAGKTIHFIHRIHQRLGSLVHYPFTRSC
jgi:hypothetical protein